MTRRPAPLAAPALIPLLSLLTLLGACAAPPPAPRLLALRLDTPPAVTAPAAAARPTTERVQLQAPVRLPALLDRDALLVTDGAAGMRALTGWRWAEPLRDAVPRLLQHDLGLQLGPAQVLQAPLPAGWVPTRLLRVDVQRLEADAAAGTVTLQAQWTLARPGSAPHETAATTPPRIGQATLRIDAAGTGPEALAVAHRLALWQLAARIAAEVR